jgi:hypothetical protein
MRRSGMGLFGCVKTEHLIGYAIIAASRRLGFAGEAGRA